MGYTHYWTFKNTEPFDINPDAIKLFKAVINIARNKYMHLIQDDSTDTQLFINGVDDESHEDFYLPYYIDVPKAAHKWATSGFNFCKTAEKPYDVVVTACLIILNHFHKDKVDISSDGHIKDWARGWALAQEALGLVPGTYIHKFMYPEGLSRCD